MIIFEKYQKILYSAIKTAYKVSMLTALAAALTVYPAYSRLFAFSVPDGIIGFLLIACSVLSLCRFIVSADSEEGIGQTAEFFLAFAVFAVAYYFRNAGGFAAKGYVFSFAALTAVPYRIREPQKKRSKKSDRFALSFFAASAVLFTAVSAFSAAVCIFRSELTAAAVIRLAGFPMLLLLAAAVRSGMKCGVCGLTSYCTARCFSFGTAAFVFVTSFDFRLAGAACIAFAILFAVFMLICVTDILTKRRISPKI